MLSSVARMASRSMSTQEPSVQELPVKELIKKENINQTKELWKLVKETKKPEKPIHGFFP